jgi:hypothetical protein
LRYKGFFSVILVYIPYRSSFQAPLIASKASSPRRDGISQAQAALPSIAPRSDGLGHKAQGTWIRENKESIRFFSAPYALRPVPHTYASVVAPWRPRSERDLRLASNTLLAIREQRMKKTHPSPCGRGRGRGPLAFDILHCCCLFCLLYFFSVLGIDLENLRLSASHFLFAVYTIIATFTVLILCILFIPRYSIIPIFHCSID